MSITCCNKKIGGKMRYYGKLTKLLGRKPLKGGLIANMKALGLKDLESSAKKPI
jgi:hypothetical protein